VTTTLWGIHAGSEGSADPLFRENGFLALGWSELGDLSLIEKSRPALQAALIAAYPDAAAGAISVWAGMLFRFVHELKAGDIVAYPSKVDRQIHFFKVKDTPYQFNPGLSLEYPNLRAAELLKSVPRGEFSPSALNEIGSALSFFRLKNNAEEFISKLEGTPTPAIYAIEEEPEVKAAALAPDADLQDFVIKRLAKHLKGHPLAHFVGHLLNLMGYRTQVSPPGKDGGIDILVHADPLGMKGGVMKVQVKSTESQIGDPDVRDLAGLLHDGERGLFVTLGTFNLDARKTARGPKGIRLIDGPELVTLLCEHYPNLDHRYRTMVPLRQMWVPDSSISPGE
jgi:restriction system protein